MAEEVMCAWAGRGVVVSGAAPSAARLFSQLTASEELQHLPAAAAVAAARGLTGSRAPGCDVSQP